MRLNGWQRIGVVLSVAWAIGAAVYVRNSKIETGRALASINYQLCTATEHTNSDCSRKLSEDLKSAIEPYWVNVAFYSLAPILAGWIVAYLILGIFRWVRRGFKPQHRGTDT